MSTDRISSDIALADGLLASHRHIARTVVRAEIASVMAACLADPDVDEHAKSLAGYILQRLAGTGE